MSSTTEASELVRWLALPAPAGDTTKAAISRAHRILKTWTWNRVRDVWHADPRISVSADELDQLRNLVRDRKYKGNGKGGAWDDTLGFMERVACLEAELRELRALVSLLSEQGVVRAGRTTQENVASQDRANALGVTVRRPERVMRDSALVLWHPARGTGKGTRTNARQRLADSK
jgi:hypothetical protein